MKKLEIPRFTREMGQILDFEALFNFSIDKCNRYVHVPLGNKGLKAI